MPTITSPPSAVATITPPLDVVWIKNPLDPSMNFHFYVEDQWQRISTKHPTNTEYPLDDPLPVVLTEGVKGDTFNLTFLLMDADWDAMQRIILSEDVLLVQTQKRQWYCVIVDDVDVDEHLWDRSGEEALRHITINFQQVAAP